MKSSLQVKWYGIQKMSSKTTDVAKLPKSLLKGCLVGYSHYGSVILTHSKSVARQIAKNAAKRGKNDLLPFEITDKQFGMTVTAFGKKAEVPVPFKHAVFCKIGNINMAIPVTLKQLGMNWIEEFQKENLN
jgi:hypothetical protein